MKKRYMLTLNQENMEALQNLLREMGYKPESGVISEMIDEFIEEQIKIGIPAARSGVKPTVLDHFRYMTEKLSSLGEKMSENAKCKE